MVKIFLFLILLFPFAGKAQVIITISGTGTGGYSGDRGHATAAELYLPTGITIDGSGNLFIADFHNNVIRKISKTGIITTVAGTGALGYSGDGGLALSAMLNTPRSVAIDDSGNLFIADYANSVIRKVNSSGIITTVAGNTVYGFGGDGGAATDASLNYPSGIAVDHSGNLFIADFINNRVRVVNSSGIISTVAGNGTAGYNGDLAQASAAELNYPLGVAVDGSGNLFIADYLNSCIRKIDGTGIITTVAGNNTTGYSGDGGAATAAQLNYPEAVSVDDSGNLFIADVQNNVIRTVNGSGIISTVAGNNMAGYSGDGGPATAAQLDNPMCAVTDASGNLFIADYVNNRIREVTSVLSSLSSKQSVTASNHIALFPNPNNGVFTLKGSLNTVNNEQVSIEVTDMPGQVVYKSNITSDNGNIDTQVTLNDIANGIYLLQIRSVQGRAVCRLVIEK